MSERSIWYRSQKIYNSPVSHSSVIARGHAIKARNELLESNSEAKQM